MLMNAQELITRITALNIWKKGDQRAPHKPLLLLLALELIHTESPRLTPFDQIETKLTQLLQDFASTQVEPIINPNYYSGICNLI